MAASNRNYELKKSQSLTEFPFTWLNNLKFVERRKSNFFLNIHFATPWTCCPGPPHHSPHIHLATLLVLTG
jgi:hypothetical protein